MVSEYYKTVAARLAAATRAYRAQLGTLVGTAGLHPGQEAVLMALAESDGQTMTELAARLSVQPPTITKMVSRLTAHGYVDRRASASDGRSAEVFLTAAGRKALVEIGGMLKTVERRALAGIDAKDRRRLKRLLRKIARNLVPGASPGEKAVRRRR